MALIKSRENIGIIFAFLAYFLFSLSDAFQKYAILTQSIFQLLLFRYCFLLLLSLTESYRKNNYNFWKSKSFIKQILRSFLSIIESCFFILSFRYLELADAHSIGSLAPVIIVVLSVLILKEKVEAKTWGAIFFGFIGVLIILRPGLSVFEFKSLLPLLGAFFLGLYQIITREVSQTDSTETSLFFTSIIGIIVTSILSFIFWKEITLFAFFILLLIAVISSVGIYLHIIALSKARASIIQPFHYTLIFWSIIFGYFFYNDLPDLPTLIGAFLIVLSGIYIAKLKLISK